MQAVRWLHTADLHLDVPLKGFKGKKEEIWRRREEHRQTLVRMIDLVEEKQLDFCFLSGDILEHGYVSHDTLMFFIEQLMRIPKTRIFIAPGNHDPYQWDSEYKRVSWPDHVHIFQGQWERHDFSEWGLHLYGRGFTSFEEKEASLPEIQHPDDRNILIVHGDYLVHERESSYFPILKSELLKLNVDYVALGHIHKPFCDELETERKTKVCYPGSPEAHSWKETGPRFVTFGSLEATGVTLEQIPISTRTYEQITVEITGLRRREEILEKILATTKEEKENYITCLLSGRRSNDLLWEYDLSWIQDQLTLEEYHAIYLEDHTIPDFDLDYYRKQNSVVGAFVRRVEERIQKEQNEGQAVLLQKALYKGLEAMLKRG